MGGLVVGVLGPNIPYVQRSRGAMNNVVSTVSGQMMMEEEQYYADWHEELLMAEEIDGCCSLCGFLPPAGMPCHCLGVGGSFRPVDESQMPVNGEDSEDNTLA